MLDPKITEMRQSIEYENSPISDDDYRKFMADFEDSHSAAKTRNSAFYRQLDQNPSSVPDKFSSEITLVHHTEMPCYTNVNNFQQHGAAYTYTLQNLTMYMNTLNPGDPRINTVQKKARQRVNNGLEVDDIYIENVETQFAEKYGKDAPKLLAVFKDYIFKFLANKTPTQRRKALIKHQARIYTASQSPGNYNQYISTLTPKNAKIFLKVAERIINKREVAALNKVIMAQNTIVSPHDYNDNSVTKERRNYTTEEEAAARAGFSRAYRGLELNDTILNSYLKEYKERGLNNYNIYKKHYFIHWNKKTPEEHRQNRANAKEREKRRSSARDTKSITQESIHGPSAIFSEENEPAEFSIDIFLHPHSPSKFLEVDLASASCSTFSEPMSELNDNDTPEITDIPTSLEVQDPSLLIEPAINNGFEFQLIDKPCNDRAIYNLSQKISEVCDQAKNHLECGIKLDPLHLTILKIMYEKKYRGSAEEFLQLYIKHYEMLQKQSQTHQTVSTSNPEILPKRQKEERWHKFSL